MAEPAKVLQFPASEQWSAEQGADYVNEAYAKSID